MVKYRLETESHWWIFDTEQEALDAVPVLVGKNLWIITPINWDVLLEVVYEN